MDASSLEVLQAHLDFVKWFVSGCGIGLVMGASAVFKYILIPMRDSYIQSNAIHVKTELEFKAILGLISEALDSTRRNIKEVKERKPIMCNYPIEERKTAIMPDYMKPHPKGA